jgi:hypothetical protein
MTINVPTSNYNVMMLFNDLFNFHNIINNKHSTFMT